MLTFLSSPKPFKGKDKENQYRAITNWLSAADGAEVILYGDSAGIEEAGRELNVKVIKDVESSSLGVPYFGAITDQTLLVKPEVAKAQLPAVVTPPIDLPGGTTPAPTSVITTPGVVEPKASTRFFGVYEVDPERYSRDLNRLSQEILQHLSSIDGVDLDITIEIHAAVKEGFAADKIRVILENARSLKFKNSSFEGE